MGEIANGHPSVRYLAVGAVNTLAGLLSYMPASGWRCRDVSANMIGYSVGILLGFQLNKRWTFGHQGDYWQSMLRYIAVLAIAYLVNLAAVLYSSKCCTQQLSCPSLGIVPFTLIGYLGSRYFAFPKPETETL